MEKVKEYTNGDVTVVWKPESCIHSAICIGGLPKVFQPKEKPWIMIEAASTGDLVEQVKKCPSGALSYYMNDSKKSDLKDQTTRIEVLENGPLLVHGTINLTLNDGSEEAKTRTTAFCRCGLSNNKPYCDGTHSKENFVG
jgi:uncharacterized Fe-S cluster protein YjdI